MKTQTAFVLNDSIYIFIFSIPINEILTGVQYDHRFFNKLNI